MSGTSVASVQLLEPAYGRGLLFGAVSVRRSRPGRAWISRVRQRIVVTAVTFAMRICSGGGSAEPETERTDGESRGVCLPGQGQQHLRAVPALQRGHQDGPVEGQAQLFARHLRVGHLARGPPARGPIWATLSRMGQGPDLSSSTAWLQNPPGSSASGGGSSTAGRARQNIGSGFERFLDRLTRRSWVIRGFVLA